MIDSRRPLLLALLVLLTTAPFASAQLAPTRINCGGEQYRDSIGNTWMSDLYFRGGETYSNTDQSVSGTRDDLLFQSERFASPDERMSYNIPVTPGVYDVRLQFAETYHKNQAVGKRVFHVFIEDILAFKDLDIYKEAGNNGYRRVEKTFIAYAVGGYINIEFVPEQGNPKINSIEIRSMSTEGPHSDIRAVVPVKGESNPRKSWVDSYSVGDQCYCDDVTTYDHNVGDLPVETSIGWMSVRQVCELLGPGPGMGNNPRYNDVQCGNGPPNDQGDELNCPGRVDMGSEGCGHIGPKWNFKSYQTSVDSKLSIQPLPPSKNKPRPFVLSAGSNSDDGSLVVNAAESWVYSAGNDYTIKKNGRIPKAFFRSHRSAPKKLAYKIGGFDKNMLYEIKLGFAEVWLPNCEKGARLMSVRINDRAYKNYSNKSSALDVYREVGCGNALILSYVQSPDSNGNFDIVIGARQEDVLDKNAMISFIEISSP